MKSQWGILIKSAIQSVVIILFTLCAVLPLSSSFLRRKTPAPSRDTVSLGFTQAGFVPSSEEEEASSAAFEEVLVEPNTEALRETEATPEDILAMASEYEKKYENKAPAGKVYEKFFTTEGATDILGRVAIRNATATKKPDFNALLKRGAPIEKGDFSLPTVLVFHTHTTESYLPRDNGVFYADYETRSLKPDRNMVRIGDEICRVLESKGIGTVHDTRVYDESYTGAYSRSRETVLKYLEEYPSIQVVLDVHRDALYYSETSRGKPTAEINGKKAAQIMLITGAQEGQVTDFPHWEENLRFALALQSKAQEKYPGLMKPVYFCQRKYNMDTAKCSLLLEMGSDSNTLEEAFYSGTLIGESLAELIEEKKG